MKLQIAFDLQDSFEEIAALADKVYPHMDIMEIGTPVIMKLGLDPVRRAKAAYSDALILADCKIADAGYYEAKAAFDAGADIVTVLGFSDDPTVAGAIKAAKECGGKIMVDMISVKPADLAARMQEIAALGADFICLHTAKDLQSGTGEGPAELFGKLTTAAAPAMLGLAGGINLGNGATYAAMHPEVIVVGEGITGQADPAEAAKAMQKIMQEA